MIRTARMALIAAGFAAFTTTVSVAHAGIWSQEGGIVAIWVTVKAHPGESSWQACRRHYQSDVYNVRRGGKNTVRCRIDHSRAYDGQGRRQNFNN